MNPNTTKQNSQDTPGQPLPAAMLGFPTQISMKAKAQGYSGYADISPSQAKATLGLITNLQNHLLPPKGKGEAKGETQGEAKGGETQSQEKLAEASQKPQNSPQKEAETKPEETADHDKLNQIEGKLSQAIEDLRNETGDKIKKELEGIRQMIQEALNEEG